MKKTNEALTGLKLNKKGFTLVELIVVIAILATLSALAVPTYNGIVQNAKKKVDLTNAQTLYQSTYAVITLDDSINKSFSDYGTRYSVKDSSGKSYKFVSALRITDRSATASSTAGTKWESDNDKIEFGQEKGNTAFRDALLDYWSVNAGQKRADNSSMASAATTGIGLKAIWRGTDGQRLNTWFIGHPEGSPGNVEIWIGQWSGVSGGKGLQAKVAKPVYKVYPVDNAYKY